MNITQTIQHSNIPEKVIAGGAAITGVSVMLNILPVVFGLIATGLAIVLTSILIYKGLVVIKKEKIAVEREELELARAKKRRKTDKVKK